MREREFRAKKVNGDWVYGDLVHTKHFTYILDISFVPAKSLPADHFVEVIPETVGQYTGLKDKNGVEIYEGDIVEYDNGAKANVIFKEGVFCGYDGYASSSDEAYTLLSCAEENPFDGFDFELEVIGNIHDK